ncbi:MAG TPA: lipid II flippase MurJ, partial [bacterium]|nr:lipid II flippase MurJ [bacterium]
FIEQVSVNTRRILFLMIPISVFMIAFRAQIVRLVLGSGSFDWEDTILTAEALGYFTISLFAQGLIPLLTRAFYALQNTRTPVLISLLAVALNIGAAFGLAPTMGVAGLALAFSLSSIVNLIFLVVILKYRLGDLEEKKILLSTLKISVASLGGLVCIQLAKYLLASLVNMQTFFGVLIQFLGAGSLGILVYLLVSLALGSEEIKDWQKRFANK